MPLLCIHIWKHKAKLLSKDCLFVTLPALHLRYLFGLWGFLSMWHQCFFKATIASCLHDALCCEVARKYSALVVNSCQTRPSQIPTPNLHVRLLTPLLNIYILAQTVSAGEPNHLALFCISMRPSSLTLPPKRSPKASIVINLKKPNSYIHRGYWGKQLLTPLDSSLISMRNDKVVTPCWTNSLYFSLCSKPQTTFVCFVSGDISPNGPQHS